MPTINMEKIWTLFPDIHSMNRFMGIDFIGDKARSHDFLSLSVSRAAAAVTEDESCTAFKKFCEIRVLLCGIPANMGHSRDVKW